MLFSILGVLLLMYLVPEGLSKTIFNRFDLNGEANVPTWYSNVLLFAVALAALGIHLFARQMKARDAAFWLGFAAMYVFLSLDEEARVHEFIDHYVKWTFVYAPLTLLFFLSCARQLLLIDKKQKLAIWILGGLILYGSGGLLAETVGYFVQKLDPSLWVVLERPEVMFEEMLEFSGTIVVLMGCLYELRRRYFAFWQEKLEMHKDWAGFKVDFEEPQENSHRQSILTIERLFK